MNSPKTNHYWYRLPLEQAEAIRASKLAGRLIKKSKHERGRDEILALLDDLPALIWRSGPDAKCDYFNKSWLAFTGRTLQQELGDGWVEGVHPQDVERCAQVFQAAYASIQPFEIEYRLRRHDGEYRWIFDAARPTFDADQNFTGFLGSCYDITERKNAEQALRDSEARYRQLIERSPDSILVVYKEKIIYINQAGVKFFSPGQPDAMLGKRAIELVQPERRDAVHQSFIALDNARMDAVSLEEKYLRLDNTLADMEIVAIPIIFDGQEAVQVIIRDITERKQSETRMRELAYRDPLTNLHNRKAFQDDLQRRLSTNADGSRKLAVFFFDVDNFKTINDQFGHDTGDAVLVEVANQLQQVVRSTDTVSRLGGDEFTLLSEVGTRADAAALADRILKIFSRPLPVRGNEVTVTLSIGISLSPDDGVDPERLIQNADHAMYTIKRTGKSGYTFH